MLKCSKILREFPWIWIAAAKLTLGASIIIVIIWFLCWLLVPHEKIAKVVGINWSYRSDLRQKTLAHDSGWGSPFGSFNVSCRRRYYGDEDCNPHRCYDSFGTGTYRTCYNRCSVYKDWCEYDYYVWPIIKTVETYGSAHDEHWPELTAGPDQRIDKTERYRVTFIAEDEWTYRTDVLNDFLRFNLDTFWRIKVNKLKMVTPLQLLQPEGN